MNEIVEEVKEAPWLIFKLNEKSYTINSKNITTIVIKPAEITFVPKASKAYCRAYSFKRESGSIN